MSSIPDPETRFSERVDSYARCRPSYPAGVLDFLASSLDFSPGMTIADIGSGTGIFSRLLLERGYRVLAVEPNQAMRLQAEKDLAQEMNFRSIAGSAEETTLPAGSVDGITAAQAFHWFDLSRTRAEFLRILRPPGPVVLIWNERLVEGTPFLVAYEEMLREHGIDYGRVESQTRARIEALSDFFEPGTPRLQVFPNSQQFDFEGLVGRVMSSSYIPSPQQPGHAELTQTLRQIFETHQVEGTVELQYETRVYSGMVLPQEGNTNESPAV